MTLKLDKIFYAIDFTQFSQQVLHYATYLTKRFDSRLYIFHSICFPKNQLYGTTEPRRSAEWDETRKLALEQIKVLMKNQPISWEPFITHGEPVEEIVNGIKEIEPDLVVAASHGLSGLRRILVGTVVERVARAIDRPFIVVRPIKLFKIRPKPIPLEIKQILVCCDFSPGEICLVQYAKQLSLKFNASLTFFHAIESPINEKLQDPTERPYGEVQQMLQDQLYERLTELAMKNSISEKKIKSVVSYGLPGETLIQYATKNKIDLILVGVQSIGTFEKLFIGSTTEFVLRHAPCPVLTMPVNLSKVREKESIPNAS